MHDKTLWWERELYYTCNILTTHVIGHVDKTWWWMKSHSWMKLTTQMQLTKWVKWITWMELNYLKNGIEYGWIENINVSYFMFIKFNTKQGLKWISWIPKFKNKTMRITIIDLFEIHSNDQQPITIVWLIPSILLWLPNSVGKKEHWTWEGIIFCLGIQWDEPN